MSPSDPSPDSSQPISPPRVSLSSGKWFVPIIVVAMLVISAASILLFSRQKHAFDYPTLCEENLRSIGIALFAYQEAYGHFPPPVMAGPDNSPRHSWRALVLPFLKENDSKNLAKIYQWNEPWDSVQNARLLNDFMPAAYHCPSAQRAKWSFKHTHFVALVGKGTAWDGSQPPPVRPSKRILLIEYSKEDIPWTKPADLSVDDWKDDSVTLASVGMGSPHGANPLALYADGTVERLPSTMKLADLKRLCVAANAAPTSSP